MNKELLSINLTKAEALVLFEWLASGERNLPDAAEEAVLLKIEAQLEPKLVEIVKPNYKELVKAAKKEVEQQPIK